jgi:hypothetical protein
MEEHLGLSETVREVWCIVVRRSAHNQYLCVFISAYQKLLEKCGALWLGDRLTISISVFLSRLIRNCLRSVVHCG